MTDLFVHLHSHTHASTFDGYGKEREFAEQVARLGQPAFGITDHGTLRGLPAAAEACGKFGVHLIPGIEAYLCDSIKQKGLTPDERKEIRNAALRSTKDLEKAKQVVKVAEAERRDRDHITIWAMNDEGLTNLFRLSSVSWNQGFYYKPRLDLDVIAAHNRGLIISTGCPGGVISKPLRDGRFDVAAERFERLHSVFGDRLYIEVMPHLMDDCPKLQSHLVALADAYDVELIATQDAHYPTRDDASAQEVLVCIQTREMMDDPDRFAVRAFGDPDFYLRSRAEMALAFEWLHGDDGARPWLSTAMSNTVALAERCTSKFVSAPPGTYLVAPELDDGLLSYSDWIVEIVGDALHHVLYSGRLARSEHGEYLDRLEYELDVIDEHGFARYFIMIWDVINFCREQGIRVGPGRGSAAGSLIGYLLGITSVDPIRHGLSFERFISPGRKDLPDIDVDIQHDRRQEVIQYLRDKYGADHVAGISTSIAMRGKRVLRDVGKTFGVPISEVERVTSVIAEGLSEEDKGDNTVEQVLADTEVGRKFLESYPDVAEAAVALEGNLRDVGIHPGGIVVTPRPVSEIVPLESRKAQDGSGRIPVVAYDMATTEKVGLVKADFLGLKTMTIEAIACKVAGVTHDQLDGVELDDPDVLRAFTESRFGGIFQFDSPSARRLCADFTFKNFGDIPAITALNRPGPMKTGLAQAYLERSKDPSKTPAVHPVYDEVTRETYGVLIYQEQVIALARKLSGYTAVEADGFRKRVAKKLGVSDDHDMFVSGAIDSGMEEAEAERLFSSIVGFGSYAFNKCVDAKTEVLAKRGGSPQVVWEIDQLGPGDEVCTSQGLRKVIANSMSIRIGYKVTLDDGRWVVASSDHRFFRQNGEEVYVMDLEIGDQLGVVSQEDVLRGRLPESGPLQGADMREASQAETEVRQDIPGRRGAEEAGLEQGAHEGRRCQDCPHGRRADGREELAIQGRSYICFEGLSQADKLYEMLRELGESCGGPSQGWRQGEQQTGEPRSSVRELPQEDPLSRDGAQQEGRRWRRGCPPALEQRPDSREGRKDQAGSRLEEGAETRARDEALVGARVASITKIGTVPMCDLTVEAPHDFFLANGILSHNCHATVYGMIAYQLMWLKVHHPGAFYTATLAIRDKDEDLLRIAAEARRQDIPVMPPDVNTSRGRFTLSDDGSHIVGSVADIKGIGAGTARTIAAARPFTSLKDFYDRTRGGDGRVTALTFRLLAQTTALRRLCPNTRLLHQNAKEIWKALAKGFEVELNPDAVADYEPDDIIKHASEKYRLYVDDTGRGEFDAMYDEIVEHCERELLTPAEVPTEGVGYAFLMARLNNAKLYSEGGGGRSARLSLLSPDGIEIVARADGDVLSACGKAIDSKGEMVLVVLHVRPTLSGGVLYSAERVWLAKDLPKAKADSLLVAVARPAKSKPKDPIASFHRCELEKAFGLEGMILRVRKHKDKRGAMMRTVGILGQTGYLRFFAFSSRCRKPDVKMLKPGRTLDLRLKKISADAACLSDRPIKEG